MQHRTTQPYQNVAPVHHIQPSQPQAQSRTLSSSQPQQQPYPSPNVYTPQSGLQSPFLNQPPQFQQQQGPNDPQTFTPQIPVRVVSTAVLVPIILLVSPKSPSPTDRKLTWIRRKTRIYGSVNDAEALSSDLQHSPVKFPGFGNLASDSRPWEANVWTTSFTVEPAAVWLSTVFLNEPGTPATIYLPSCTEPAASDELSAHATLPIHYPSAFARTGHSPPLNNLEQP